MVSKAIKIGDRVSVPDGYKSDGTARPWLGGEIIRDDAPGRASVQIRLDCGDLIAATPETCHLWRDMTEKQPEPTRFELAREPATVTVPKRFEGSERTKQKKLIDGLDCLPGQLDLF